VTIRLDRSASTIVDGVHQQLNNITAFIDASSSTAPRKTAPDELRTNDGTGMLKTSAGGLLPFNVNGFHNAPTDHDPSFFLGGDIRANEQIALTAMHTLFVREHNHHAQRLRDRHPGFSGDEIYEHARAIVAAEIQAITYNEFLPMLLGPGAIPPYQGYRPEVDAGIEQPVRDRGLPRGPHHALAQLRRLDENNQPIAAGHVPLADGFFNPQTSSTRASTPFSAGSRPSGPRPSMSTSSTMSGTSCSARRARAGSTSRRSTSSAGATTACPASTTSVSPTGSRRCRASRA
jgi:peroxidase